MAAYLELEVLNKIKHFLWRFSHNSHALRRNLQQCRMKIHDLCVMCHRCDEDGGQLFFKCKEVKQLWRLLGLENLRVELSTMTCLK